MATFYSAHSKGFFDSTLFATLPSDAVAVTDANYTALLAAQGSGQQITADSAGNPVAVTPTPPPPPATPALTLAEQAQVAIAAGMPVVSTSDATLNATYPIDAATQSHIQSEMLALLVAGAFADGGMTVAWPDLDGTTHTLSITKFKALALACAAYVASLYKCVNGTATTLPATPVTIA